MNIDQDCITLKCPCLNCCCYSDSQPAQNTKHVTQQYDSRDITHTTHDDVCQAPRTTLYIYAESSLLP